MRWMGEGFCRRCYQADRSPKTGLADEDDDGDAENDRLPRNTRKHSRGLVLNAVGEGAPKRKRRSFGQGDNENPEVVVASAPSNSMLSFFSVDYHSNITLFHKHFLFQT